VSHACERFSKNVLGLDTSNLDELLIFVFCSLGTHGGCLSFLLRLDNRTILGPEQWFSWNCYCKITGSFDLVLFEDAFNHAFFEGINFGFLQELESELSIKQSPPLLFVVEPERLFLTRKEETTVVLHLTLSLAEADSTVSAEALLVFGTDLNSVEKRISCFLKHLIFLADWRCCFFSLLELLI